MLTTHSAAMSTNLVVMTAHAFIRAHEAFEHHLRAAGMEVRTVNAWEQLLTPATPAPDLMLIDYDTISTGNDGARTAVSGFRLVTLLGRQLADQPIALIVMTALDYAEVEELAHAGTHAFISPQMSPTIRVEVMRAAVARQRARCGVSVPARCEMIPVLTAAEAASGALAHEPITSVAATLPRQ